MDFLYRLLGVTANISEGMSHLRINFIPLNIILMVGGGVVTMISGVLTLASLTQLGPPVHTNVAKLMQDHAGGGSYATVSGVLHPELSVTSPGEDSDSPATTWVLLADTGQKRGILVKLEDGATQTGPATLQGTLGSVDSALAAELSSKGSKLGGFQVDGEITLLEGERPPSLLVAAPVFLVCGIGTLMLVIVMCTQYVVFRKTDQVPGDAGAVVSPSNRMLRATGRFILDGVHSKRFLNVPAVLADLDTGERALLANIDASSKFMGITTTRRVGTWAIIVQPHSLKQVEVGLMYIGVAALPAVRFSFVDASDRSYGSAIVACETVAERDHVLQRLTQPQSVAPVAVVAPTAPGASAPEASVEGLPVASVLPEPPIGSSTPPAP